VWSSSLLSKLLKIRLMVNVTRAEGRSSAEGTPKHRAFMDAMQQSSCHIIATMRTKIEYAEGTNNGRKTYQAVEKVVPKY